MSQTEVVKRVGVGDAAPNVVLKSEDQADIALAHFWKKQPVALVFVRHFG